MRYPGFPFFEFFLKEFRESKHQMPFSNPRRLQYKNYLHLGLWICSLQFAEGCDQWSDWVGIRIGAYTVGHYQANVRSIFGRQFFLGL
jgi:hypothetical protein